MRPAISGEIGGSEHGPGKRRSQVRPSLSGEIRGSEHYPGKWEVSLPDLNLHLEDQMGEGDAIPPDHPLGLILKYWGNNPGQRTKRREE